MKTRKEFIKYIENFQLEENRSDKKIGIFPNQGEQAKVANKDNKTITEKINFNSHEINIYINEFWTSKQRQANSLHEISYRACFKPQLPRFFIKNLTNKNDYVYDPFLGRGTTVIEAALNGRRIMGNDVNPLSRILSEPRLQIPSMPELKKYLENIPLDYNLSADRDLSMFYHPKTESELLSIKKYILKKERNNDLNKFDKWIRMVGTNRLTGHSTGFFSVYTMPPNQAVTAKRQKKLNKKRNQKPEYRAVKKRILKKSSYLIRDMTPKLRNTLNRISKSAKFLNNDAGNTEKIPDNSIQLTVTSPPFLNIVHYARDNWLRCWFNGLDAEKIEKNITMAKTVDKWSDVMQAVFNELHRITQRGGWVAFEVGEVKKGKINLEEYVVPIGIQAGFEPVCILINQQEFTKTSNIWGVKNNKKGTNSNRIAVFKKIK